MHANFSTAYMREVGGKEYFEALMEEFEQESKDHIAVYGPDNHMRLTGKHETASSNSSATALPTAARRSACRTLHQQRLQGLPGRPPAELAGRPLPDRFADPETIIRSDRREGLGRGVEEPHD